MARRQSVDPVSDDAYDRMDERIAAHFERVRSLLDDAPDDRESTGPVDSDRSATRDDD